MRTDEVVYELGDRITLIADIQDNGHLATKTQFLYRQNLQTGEVRYINAQVGLLPPGEITDLSGNVTNFRTVNEYRPYFRIR